MSKTRNLLHIVFTTKHRLPTITEEFKKELYLYIFGILKNKNCFLHRMNGIVNHIHILIDLSPNIALADLIRDIKLASNKWMKNNPHFPDFTAWGEGYFAVSVSPEDLEKCKQYIIGQEKHHLFTDLMTEMDWIIHRNGMTWYVDDWK